MSLSAILALFLAAAASLTFPMLLKPMLSALQVVDQPNERSSHSQATVRGGGASQLVALILAFSLVLIMQIESSAWLIAIGIGSTLAGLTGFVEDTRGLRVSTRAAFQIAVGLLVAAPLGFISETPWWAIGVSTIAIAAYINVANFMDGIDGVSSLHGTAVGLVYFVAGLLFSVPWLEFAGLVIAIIFAAFLPWNLTKPGIFLGDVGSYLLGAAIAAMGTGAILSGVPPLAVIAPLTIYLADTTSTLIRRAVNGELVLRAHRTHAYQRLVDTGLSHVYVSAIVTAFTVVASAVGLGVATGLLYELVGLALLCVLAGIYLALPRLRANRAVRSGEFEKGSVAASAVPETRDAFPPKRWAVVGSSGFVGSALVSHLRERGESVTELTAPRLTLSPRVSNATDIAELAHSLPELSEFTESLRGNDVVVNAAGLATPDSSASKELFGANALLPSMIAYSADIAGAERVLHISSAAVQGRRAILDESLESFPFSPYSQSKALGERAFLATGTGEIRAKRIIIRATSVQGVGRRTTESLQRIARSPLATVARPGSQPTVVSSIDGLVDLIVRVSTSSKPVGPIVLQPWEGFSVRDVLRCAGGKEPLLLPRWLCQAILLSTKLLGRAVPAISGIGRRVEMMWFGQRQASSYSDVFIPVGRAKLNNILSRSRDESEGQDTHSLR